MAIDASKRGERLMGRWLGALAVAGALLAAGGPAGAADMHMAAGCAPAGSALALSAVDHAFDKDCLAVPAGQAFTIRFDNKDDDRHNVAIVPSHTATTSLFQGDIVLGPRSIDYAVGPLEAGTYHFHCQIHPNLMMGTFQVGPPSAHAAAPAPAPAPAPAAAPAPAPAPSPPATPTPGAGPTGPATPSGHDTPAGAKPAPPAPHTAADQAPKGTPAPGPSRSAEGVTPGSKAAPGSHANLPHTGPRSQQVLLVLAGVALAAGGLSLAGGARRPTA